VAPRNTINTFLPFAIVQPITLRCRHASAAKPTSAIPNIESVEGSGVGEIGELSIPSLNWQLMFLQSASADQRQSSQSTFCNSDIQCLPYLGSICVAKLANPKRWFFNPTTEVNPRFFACATGPTLACWR
jgi:hypothetical protein